MNIDLTKLITNIEEELIVKTNIEFEKDLINSTNIKELKDTKFEGEITKLYDNNYELSGVLQGTMILPDDITLEPVEYKFNVNLEEKFNEFTENPDNNLKIVQNRLDISEFLWQNILVEIPLKVVSEKNKDLKLQGNGWRFITEEELKKENNSPFSELKDKFN